MRSAGDHEGRQLIPRWLKRLSSMAMPPGRAAVRAQLCSRRLTPTGITSQASQGLWEPGTDERNFLIHEGTESDLMDDGIEYEEAHAAALHSHPACANYHPEVIDQFPDHFDNNYRSYWGLDPR